jgi:hypothetical protein
MVKRVLVLEAMVQMPTQWWFRWAMPLEVRNFVKYLQEVNVENQDGRTSDARASRRHNEEAVLTKRILLEVAAVPALTVTGTAVAP